MIQPEVVNTWIAYVSLAHLIIWFKMLAIILNSASRYASKLAYNCPVKWNHKPWLKNMDSQIPKQWTWDNQWQNADNLPLIPLVEIFMSIFSQNAIIQWHLPYEKFIVKLRIAPCLRICYDRDTNGQHSSHDMNWASSVSTDEKLDALIRHYADCVGIQRHLMNGRMKHKPC